MSKETRLTPEQTLMKDRMQELQAENAKLGGMLFAAVGVGEKMAFLFPTPFTIEKNGKPVADVLLVITKDGYKTIYFDRRVIGVKVEAVAEMIKNRLGVISSSQKSGYENGILTFDDVFISSKKVEDHRNLPVGNEHPEWYIKAFHNCNLREESAQTHTTWSLLGVNRKRAQTDHSDLQKAGNLP